MNNMINSMNDEKKYINSNVYKNEILEIRNIFIKLEQLLQEDLKNPNDLKIKTWIKNYLEFVLLFEKELNKDILIGYLKEMFKKYDKSGKYYANLDNLIKNSILGETTTLEPLKIINVKKPKINSSINVVANPMIKEFFKSFGYEIDVENSKLIDADGNVENKNRIEINKASYLKRQLIILSSRDKSSKNNGLIDGDYQKNKITSILLDMKIVKSLREQIKFNTTQSLEKPNNVEILKGMGKC